MAFWTGARSGSRGRYQTRTGAELRLARIRCAPSDLVLVRLTQWIADRQHGPLPLLLVCLTVVTGLVDAFSYLRLGHVFVANMTGNVVFLGFALAGVGEISIVASLLAIVAFALGAALGGRWAAGRPLHRGHLLAAATAVQAGAVLVASVIASTAGVDGPTVRLTLIGLLALAMGGQNAVVRRLAVPDLTTTVLTLTVTGLVADTTAPISARPAADLGSGDAGGCAHRRCPVGLGRPRRPALVGSRTAGRLCCRRLSGGWPPTIADLAVAHDHCHGAATGARAPRSDVAATNALLLAEVSKQGHTVTCEPSEVIAADPAPASRGAEADVTWRGAWCLDSHGETRRAMWV